MLLPPSKAVALVEFLAASDARKAFKRLAYTRFQHVPLYLEWAPVKVCAVLVSFSLCRGGSIRDLLMLQLPRCRILRRPRTASAFSLVRSPSISGARTVGSALLDAPSLTTRNQSYFHCSSAERSTSSLVLGNSREQPGLVSLSRPCLFAWLVGVAHLTHPSPSRSALRFLFGADVRLLILLFSLGLPRDVRAVLETSVIAGIREGCNRRRGKGTHGCSGEPHPCRLPHSVLSSNLN